MAPTRRGDDLDNDEILRDAVAGKPLRDIARKHGVDRREIDHVLDLAAERLFGAAGLRRTMYVEAERLEHIKQMLFARAMAGGEDALHAATVYCKASERYASMTGANHPAGHMITIFGNLEPIEQETSTQNFRRVLDGVLGITTKER